MDTPRSLPDYEPIAVIGMSCRFPGADSPEAFRRNLLSGVESRSVFTREELLAAGVPPAVADSPDSIAVACRVKGQEYFDPAFFGYSTQEARLIDPQQRLFLECSWHAMEDAGYIPKQQPHPVGVFGGSRLSTYLFALGIRPYHVPGLEADTARAFQALISNDKDYLTSRVAYKLGLTGPALTVQTACSTSLVAIHLACRSLQNSECDMALAGGAALLVPQEMAVLRQDGMILSPSGRCRPFDAKADGTIFGHGVGVVLLKRLEDALADNDYIHAVVRGSAVTNDGSAKAGFSAPGFEGQMAVVAEAIDSAGISADDIGYVETHGTGTLLGDPVEVAALTKAFRLTTDKTGFCCLGAVKANIGHLDTTAGVAGFIKTAMIVREGEIPPLINFSAGNPHIDFASSPFVVPETRRPWPQTSLPRRAGVSSFGIGGTNCHIILEQAPEQPKRRLSPAGAEKEPAAELFLLSAHSGQELREYAKSIHSVLESQAVPQEEAFTRLQDVCYTSRTGRAVFPVRFATTARTLEELSSALSTLANEKSPTAPPKCKPAFLFTGQGSQSPGMTKSLYHSCPGFARHMDACAAAYAAHTGGELRRAIFESDAETMRRTDMAQPAIFAVEYALGATVMDWGLQPAVLLGHSIGQYAAACLAGAMSLETAMNMVIQRGKLMQSLPTGGGMASVFASQKRLEPLLAAVNAQKPGILCPAAFNAPEQTVVSGDMQAVKALISGLDREGIDYKELFVSHGFHSHLMDPILEAFRAQAAGCDLRPACLPLISDLTGLPATAEELVSADYWTRHMREPVRFMQGLDSVVAAGATMLVEIGPRAILSGLAAQHPTAGKLPRIPLLQHGDNDLNRLHEQLGRLFALGANPHWDKVDGLSHGRRVPLPGYPFQRKRCWFDDAGTTSGSISAPSAEPLRTSETKTAGAAAPEPTLVYRREWTSQPFQAQPSGAWLVLGTEEQARTCSDLLASQGTRVCLKPEEEHWDALLLLSPQGTGAPFPERPEQNGVESGCLNALTDPLFQFSQNLLKAISLLGKHNRKRLSVLVFPEETHTSAGLDKSSWSLSSVAGASIAAITNVARREYPHLDIRLLHRSLGTDLTLALLATCAENLPLEARLEGKVLLVPRTEAEPIRREDSLPCSFDGNGSYLITGATGGIAPHLAAWLAEHGAGHIILAGRTLPADVPLPAGLGATIHPVRCDVADPLAVARLFTEGVPNAPAIRGIFHLAGSLADKTLAALTPADLHTTFSGKVAGAYNLLRYSGQLDFFMAFSSISGVFGAPGQAAYAAANAALDALCAGYRANGRQAQSIRWGAWDVGMARAEEIKTILAGAGMQALPPQTALTCLEHVMCANLPGALVMHVDPERFTPLREMATDLSGTASGLDDAAINLSGATFAQRVELLTRIIGNEVAKLLEMDTPPAKNDDLIAAGLDSLIFLTLAQRLGKRTGLHVPPAALFGAPTVGDMAVYLANLVEKTEADKKAQGEERGARTRLPGVPEKPDAETVPGDAHAPFALTDVQYAYWVGRSAGVELGNIGCHTYFELEGEHIDIPRLERAWNRLIERHDMLRCVFLPEGMQHVLAEVPFYTVQADDLTEASETAIAANIAATRGRMAAQVHDATAWPLFELCAAHLPGSRTLLRISLDLLIADFHSITILMRELEQAYRAPEDMPPPLAYSFRQYVLREESMQEQTAFQEARSYWRNRLDSLPPAPALPLAARPDQVGTPKFTKLTHKITPEQWERLKQGAARHGATPSCLLLCIYADVLAAWSGGAHFCINLTLFNRKLFHDDVMHLVGDFTSTSLLEVNLKERLPFVRRVANIQSRFWSDMDHRDWSGVRVIRDLHQRRGSMPGALMPVVFTANIGGSKNAGAANSLGRLVFNAAQTPQVWLDYQVFEEDGGLTVMWDYIQGLFPADMPEAMFAANLEALLQLSGDAALWDAECLPSLPSDQQARRLEYNATTGPLPHSLLPAPSGRGSSFHLIHAGTTLDAAKMAEHAAAIAERLRRAGVCPGDMVGVRLPRGPEQVAAVLGTHMAGGAYIPIMPSWPDARVHGILEMSGAKALVSEEDAPSAGLAVISPRFFSGQDTESPPAYPDGRSLSPDDTAYVIFTSGSTGTPKGVAVSHKACLNTIDDLNRRFSVGPEDRILGVSELAFDLSVYDIFGALHAHAGLVLTEEHLAKDPAHWHSLITGHAVTVWNSAPQLMRMLVEYCEAMNLTLPSLRLVFLSGDWIPVSLPERILALAPGCRVISLGGATEAAIWSIFHPVQPQDAQRESIPYGRPLRNQTMHVLNEKWQPAPEWVPGDLYIGGSGLAQGYLGDERRTRDSFISHPDTGEQLYRTGDMARFLPENMLEFLGRSDHQVKIRGHRIEPGEIETVLEKHPLVRAALVMPVGEKQQDKYLAAYISTGRSGAPGDLESILTAYLGQHLPPYMLPAAFVFLPDLPVTSNGKIDRKALPAPHRTQANTACLRAPETKEERQLAAIWEEVLQCPAPDIHSDFFALGGDSLLAGRLVLRIRAVMGATLPLGAVFEFPILADMAAHLFNMEQCDTTAALPLLMTATSELETRAVLSDELSAIRRSNGSAAQPDTADGLGTVFLTGATGFLGGAILEKLLTLTSSRIICLVRAPGADTTAAHKRLLSGLKQRGICIPEPSRISVIPGNLEDSSYGLSQKDFAELGVQVDTIIHCGARVQYAQPYATLAPANVGGTLTALRLALEGVAPARFIHVSTAAVVSGAPQTVDDNTPLNHGGQVAGGYAQSKWVAERLLQKAAAAGLPFTVFRPGTVSGDSRTGFWNTEDFPCRFALGCVALGLAPDLEKELALLPVDIAAEAIVRLSLQSGSVGRTWNMVPPPSTTLYECATVAQSLGLSCGIVPFDEWKKALLEACSNGQTNPLEPLLPLFPDTLSTLPVSSGFDTRGFARALAEVGLTPPAPSRQLPERYATFLFPQVARHSA